MSEASGNKPRIVAGVPSILNIINRYRLFFTVAIAYAVAFVIVYFVIPRVMYLWWGYNVGSATAIGYYMEFAVPLMEMAPLLLIVIGLIVHVASEVTDPVTNAVRQVAVRKLVEDKRFSDKIDKMAENYLNEHLAKYGIVKVVRPGAGNRVVVLFKRGEHRDVIFM
jgi:membrane protein implicated in regulation of membrane protease activity